MKDTGIILIDHGSRLEAANRVLEDLAALYAAETGAPIVEYAHMELATPTLADAYARCVERGARSVVVAPYFLGPGRHASRDIPHLAAEAAAAHPGVPYRIADPLGVDARIARVLQSRVEDAIARP